MKSLLECADDEELVQFATTTHAGLLATRADQAQDEHERAALRVQVAYLEDTRLSVLIGALREDAVQAALRLSESQARAIADYFGDLMCSELTAGPEREHGWGGAGPNPGARHAGRRWGRWGRGDVGAAWASLKSELATAEKGARDGKSAAGAPRAHSAAPARVVPRLCQLLTDGRRRRRPKIFRIVGITSGISG